MTEIDSTASPTTDQVQPSDARTIYRAARVWLVTQALFIVFIVLYGVIFPPNDGHWAWWLCFADGPRFTPILQTNVSRFCMLSLAGMWSWSNWEFARLSPRSDAISAITRWGGLIILFGGSFAEQAFRISGYFEPSWFPATVFTASAIVVLAVVLQLRRLPNSFRDRAIDISLELMMGLSVLYLLALATTWLGIRMQRGPVIAIQVLQLARTALAIVVMIQLMRLTRAASPPPSDPLPP